MGEPPERPQNRPDDRPDTTPATRATGEPDVRDSAARAGGEASVAGSAAAEALVQSLVRTFREQLERALSVELDGSTETLAFVDHYLRLAESEDREPILTLLAAGAGAYFGEMVRAQMGGTWVGDGRDPRRLRLLVEPQFVYFSPIDQAYEAITGSAIDPADPRVPGDPPFDPAFHLRPAANGDEEQPGARSPQDDDAEWLDARLSEMPPVPEDEFHSLTCRFETLQLMLELLAAKHAAEGRSPRQWGVSDYLAALG